MPSNLWSSLAWFVLIVVAIPAVLWLVKRTPIGGAAAQGAMLRSVAALPLSTSQRIVTVEVGHGAARRWLVLGVTPQSITTLHTMEPEGETPLPGSGATVAAPGFGALLAQRLGRRAAGPETSP